MADLLLSIVQEPSDDVGYLAGLAVGDDLIVAVGGGVHACPTVLASSNAQDFEPRATPRDLGLRDVLIAGREVWVCGEFGQLAVSRDHGATWQVIDVGTTGCLFGIARASDGAVWVVGEEGFAARVVGDAIAWSGSTLATTASLSAVYAVKDEVVVLGFDGRLRRWRAGGVTEIATGSDRPLTALAVTARIVDRRRRRRVHRALARRRVVVARAHGRRRGSRGDRRRSRMASSSPSAIAGVILVSRDDGRTWASVASKVTAHLWSVEKFGGGALIGGDAGLIVKLAPSGDDAWADRINVFGGAKPLDAAFVAGPVGFITGGMSTYLAALPEPESASEPGRASSAAADFLTNYGVAAPRRRPPRSARAPRRRTASPASRNSGSTSRCGPMPARTTCSSSWCATTRTRTSAPISSRRCAACSGSARSATATAITWRSTSGTAPGRSSTSITTTPRSRAWSPTRSTASCT